MYTSPRGRTMDARQQRGLAIAANQNIKKAVKAWSVPSQSGKGSYLVLADRERPWCQCPDHEEHGGRCKHIYAVEFVIQRELFDDGTVVETKTLTVTERKTYQQESWPAYNRAQCVEKDRLQALLA